jgi:hypothetical protein
MKLLRVAAVAALVSSCQPDTSASVAKDSTPIPTNADADAATLRIPVIIDGLGNADPLAAAAVNARLQALGAPLLPQFVEISSSEPDLPAAMNRIHASIEATLRPLGADAEFANLVSEAFPGESNQPGLATCYTGQAARLADLVQGLTDSLYSDQMTLWGWKHQATTIVFPESTDEFDVMDFLGSESTLWKNWTGAGDDVLILSAIGDEGLDVQESLVSRCAN